MKTRVIRIVKCLLFCLLLAFVLVGLNLVLKPVPNPYHPWHAYQQLEENSIDVLVIGNSHAYTAFAPMQLWESSGITSWVLGAGATNTQHKTTLLEQGLKTQQPQLILFELWMPDDTETQRPEVANALYAHFPFGLHKAKSVLRDSPPEDFWNNFLPLIQNADRYAEVSRRSFDFLLMEGSEYRKVTGGATPLTGLSGRAADIQFPPFEIPVEIAFDMRDEFAQLERAVYLAEKSGAEIIFFFTPVASDRALSVIEEIRFELYDAPKLADVRLIDMNDFASDLQLSFEDFFDPEHLQLWGMRRATAWIEAEIIVPSLNERRNYSQETIEWWDAQSAHWLQITEGIDSIQDQEIDYWVGLEL